MGRPAYAIDGVAAAPIGRTSTYPEKWQRFDRLLVKDATIEVTIQNGQAGEYRWIDAQRWQLVDGVGDLLLTDQFGVGAHLTFGERGMAPVDVPEWDRAVLVDVGAGADQGAILFATEAQDSVKMQADGDAARLRIYSRATARLVSELRPGDVISLPAGEWHGVVVGAPGRATRVALTFGEQRALYAPRLTARSVLEGGSNGFPVADDGVADTYVSMSWYDIEWAHGDVDLDRVNGLIHDYLDEVRESFERSAARCPEGNDAALIVRMTPELLSYDLVSFSVTIMQCLCNTNDEVLQRALTIDLANGRVVDPAELFADEEALRAAWWENAQSYDSAQALEGGMVDAEPIEFTTVGLSAYGVMLGVEMEDAHSGTRWTLGAFVAFEDLPDAFDPALRQRAQSGRDVPLPNLECGC